MDGDTVEDVFGKNDGTIEGDPKIAEGKVGDALDFDGVDDYVDCGDDTSLDLSGDTITLEAWVKPNSHDAGVMGKCYVGPEDTYLLGIRPDKSIWFGIRTSSWKPSTGDGTPVPLNQWNHIAGVYNGSQMIRYLNGVETGTVDVQSGDINIVNKVLTIGDFGKDRGFYFDGIIDEVRIYSRALNEDEVNQNMDAEGMAVVAKHADKLALTWGEIKVPK